MSSSNGVQIPGVTEPTNEVPDFTACNNDNNCVTAKNTHAILLKTRTDVVNMNAALVDTLLSLIPTAFNSSTSKNGLWI
jgi:hypothetical protein